MTIIIIIVVEWDLASRVLGVRVVRSGSGVEEGIGSQWVGFRVQRAVIGF